jgi:DNA-binding HxlR family transcriptional regulator
VHVRRDFRQFCPVALASEVLAERWTLLIVRELLCGSSRFNDIRRGVPKISASLLKQRLETLEHAEIVERRASAGGRAQEYVLTPAGRELQTVVAAIGVWGQRWAREIRPEDLDPGWLVWNVHRRLNLAEMPPGRTIIEFEFTDAPSIQRRFWLVHADGDVEVCLKQPGFGTDIRVSSTVRVLAEVWRGIRPLPDEVRAGRLRIDGPPALRRSFPRWLLLSIYASAERQRRPAASASERRAVNHPPRRSA